MNTRVQLPRQFRALTIAQSVSTLGNALTTSPSFACAGAVPVLFAVVSGRSWGAHRG